VFLFYRNTTATIFVTLAERLSVAAPYYLFAFRSRTHSGDVFFVLESESTDSRCEKFSIDVDEHFADLPIGGYTYAIHEQESSTNIDPDASGAILEVGVMELLPADAQDHVTPNSTTTFIQPS
jgi:hypothetical protein